MIEGDLEQSSFSVNEWDDVFQGDPQFDATCQDGCDSADVVLVSFE